MSVYMNVRMYKIMRTQIKLRVRTYAAYANCQTLSMFALWKKCLVFQMSDSVLSDKFLDSC